MKKRIFSSLILASFLVGCGGGGSSSNNNSSSSAIDTNKVEIAEVFPTYPKVPLNGNVKLTPVVMNDYTKEIRSSSLDNQIVIEWKSLNPAIAMVDSNGIIYGRSVGETTIEAVTKRAVDANTTVLDDTVQIPVKVVNTMGNIAEISLSPTRATIDKNGGTKEFYITAIDNSGVFTSLNQGIIEFNISNPQGNAEKIINQPSTLSSGENKVIIDSADNRVGYVFITPIYRDKDDINLTTTGTPLAVQVSDIPKAIPDDKDPAKNLDAGKYLDLEVDEKDGKKELHVVQYDNKSKQLKYSYFNGTWKSENIRPATTEANSGIDAKIVLSPFDNNYKKPIVVALENENIELWYQNNFNNWINKRVSQNKVLDYNLSKVYSGGDEFLDVAVDNDNKLLYIAYFSPLTDRIYLTYSSMSETSDLDFSNPNHILTIDTANHVQSLSLALNIYNEPRIAFSTLKNGNENELLNGLFYASKSGASFNVEKLSGTTGDEKGVVLRLDKTNKPAIIYYTPSDKLFYVVRSKEPSGFTWTSSSINFNEPITNITGIDFVFDHYNSARVVFNSNDKIRYARRLYEKDNEWVVETPEEGTGKFGEYKAIKIDSENRVHMVYTSDEDKWFKYWAEPIFFDYRRYEVKNPTYGIDVVN